MRRFDKTKNMLKANILAEQRYMESKGLIKEENCVETVNDKADLKSKISEKYDSDAYLIDECLEVIFNKKHTTPLEIVDTIEGNNKLIDLFIITHNSEQLKYILEVNPDNVTIDMCGLYKTISLYRNDDGDITRKMDKEFIEKYKYLDPSNRSELDEGIDWDRAADRNFPNPHDGRQPSDEVTSIENNGYDMDNYPKYSFEAESATGVISSLKILSELAGWEFTSGCKSKNPSIIKICGELQNKLDNYYESFPVVKTSYGDSISNEDWEKYNKYIKEIYSHDIVTKIIQTELNKSLADAIEELLSKGLIDDIKEPERGFREPD